jgi:hypothetical protein
LEKDKKMIQLGCASEGKDNSVWNREEKAIQGRTEKHFWRKLSSRLALTPTIGKSDQRSLNSRAAVIRKKWLKVKEGAKDGNLKFSILVAIRGMRLALGDAA